MDTCLKVGVVVLPVELHMHIIGCIGCSYDRLSYCYALDAIEGGTWWYDYITRLTGSIPWWLYLSPDTNPECLPMTTCGCADCAKDRIYGRIPGRTSPRG